MVVVHNLTSVTIEKQANCVARFLMAVMELSLKNWSYGASYLDCDNFYLLTQ